MEIWKQIPSQPKYEASNKGRIRHAKRKKVRKLSTNTSKRLFFTINNSKRMCMTAHAAVCEAFHGERPEGMICCHNDGNHLNNVPENLRWDTYGSNQRDREAHGSVGAGENNGHSKLTWEQVDKIRAKSKDGHMEKDLAQEYGVHIQTVYRIINEKMWKPKFHPSVYAYRSME